MPRENSLLATIRVVRRKVAENGPTRTAAEADFERVALPEADGDVLRDLLIAERARVVIEIGLAYGSSALAIGEALVAIHGEENPRHLVIDAYQDHFQNAGWKTIAAAGLIGICALIPERSQLALPRLVAEKVIVDAAFVDGSHIFHNVFVDLYFLRELVRPGGLVVLDDCQWASVATAVHYFEVNAGWRPEAIHEPTRLHAFRLPDPRVEPTFESFKSFWGH